MKIASVFVVLLSFAISRPFVALALAPSQLVNRTDGLCASLIIPLLSYNCQEYMVETGDGFLLGVQHMSSKQATGAKKGSVFLMHGIFLGGDVWVLSERSQALGFILADANYDVWIGNTRTTRFSYGHVFYERTDKGFWDWSVDEMADQDLPAMLGLVYSTAGTKTHYVGYSQGSQQLFAAFSQGQLLDYVNKTIMLAPVAYVDHGTSPVELAFFDLRLDKILEAANVYDFSSQTPMGKQIVDIICPPASPRCYNTWFYLLAGKACCLDTGRRPLIDQYETQTTSVKNMAHYAQQGRKKSFAKFDYGIWGNLKKYYMPWAPEYKIANIPYTDELLLISGLNDALADPKDVNHLLAELKPGFRTYTSPEYGHLDFIFAYNAYSQVYSQLIAFLESSYG